MVPEEVARELLRQVADEGQLEQGPVGRPDDGNDQANDGHQKHEDNPNDHHECDPEEEVEDDVCNERGYPPWDKRKGKKHSLPAMETAVEGPSLRQTDNKAAYQEEEVGDEAHQTGREAALRAVFMGRGSAAVRTALLL